MAVARTGSFAWTSTPARYQRKQRVDGVACAAGRGHAGEVPPWPCGHRRSRKRSRRPMAEYSPPRTPAAPRSCLTRSGAAGIVRQATARSEVAVQFADAVLGEGDEARLVELRCAHEQRALARVVVGEDQAHELSATQPRRVEEHDREAIHVGAQGRR
jgi:ribosomal protein L3